MSRDVYLVGSVPLASARDVFETVSAALGPRLKRIPDGETGDRINWVFWQEKLFAQHPAFERSDKDFQLHATSGLWRRYRLKPDVSSTMFNSTICSMPMWRYNRIAPLRR